MSTPERQQDPGEHGYGGVQRDKEHDGDERPLEDPEADSRQPETQDDDAAREQDG